VLTLGWGCLGRWLRGAVWAVVEASGGGAIGAAVEQGKACESSVLTVEVRGSEEARGLFIGGLRRFGGEDFSGGRSPASSSGFSMSSRISRRPVTRRLERWRVNLCR
jgi:hypothetical protein